MIDEFVKQHPDIISKVTYSKAPAPELAGKIKAQQNADRVDIDLVLTGTDGSRPVIEQGLWIDRAAQVRRPAARHEGLPAARAEDAGAGRQQRRRPSPTTRPGRCSSTCRPRCPNPPRSAEELLAYAKANPGKVRYARPANSGPGRTFLMGLPYILGDKDPKDPVNGWDKTWAYLKELNQYVDVYPSGHRGDHEEPGQRHGRHHRHARRAGTSTRASSAPCPKEAEVGTLKGFHWVTDAHYAVVPKGVVDRQAGRGILQLLQYMLTPEQQAKAYDKGYFYPGPAVKGVDLSMAPAGEPGRIKEYGAPGVRRADRRQPDRGATRREERWSRRSTSGTARSAARR